MLERVVRELSVRSMESWSCTPFSLMVTDGGGGWTYACDSEVFDGGDLVACGHRDSIELFRSSVASCSGVTYREGLALARGGGLGMRGSCVLDRLLTAF